MICPTHPQAVVTRAPVPRARCGGPRCQPEAAGSRPARAGSARNESIQPVRTRTLLGEGDPDPWPEDPETKRGGLTWCW